MQTYRCVCQPGFEGKNCDRDINECESNPCLNDGRCVDLNNAYRCDCAGTGFEGDHCQYNVNECAAEVNPCFQGGCKDTNGSYVCTCHDGFCGRNCQRQNPCLLVRCLTFLPVTNVLLKKIHRSLFRLKVFARIKASVWISATNLLTTSASARTSGKAAIVESG